MRRQKTDNSSCVDEMIQKVAEKGKKGFLK